MKEWGHAGGLPQLTRLPGTVPVVGGAGGGGRGHAGLPQLTRLPGTVVGGTR